MRAASQSMHLHMFGREECVYSGEYLRRNCEWRSVQTMSNADLIVSGSNHQAYKKGLQTPTHSMSPAL